MGGEGGGCHNHRDASNHPPASNAIGFRLHGRGLKGLMVYGGRGGRGCGAKRAANHRSAFRWSDVVVVVLVWPRCAIRPLQSVLSSSLWFSVSICLPVCRPFSFSRSFFRFLCTPSPPPSCLLRPPSPPCLPPAFSATPTPLPHAPSFWPNTKFQQFGRWVLC